MSHTAGMTPVQAQVILPIRRLRPPILAGHRRARWRWDRPKPVAMEVSVAPQ
jgi:hypothetical protein